MRRQIPLALKLGLTFSAATLITVVVVYFITALSITRQFDVYREANREHYAEQIRDMLTGYYSYTQSWINAYELFYIPIRVKIGSQIIETSQVTVDARFSLANEEGRIFLTTTGDPDVLRQLLTPEEKNAGYPIVVDQERVGTLLLIDAGPNLEAREMEFLASAKRSALLGGGIASSAAVFLFLVMINQVLSPLHKLARATERIAHGDLPEKVSLRARDEFGQLGFSFNQMLENLRRSETVRKTMTADIAHELRTPVTIIQGTLEAVLDGIYEASNETIGTIYEETLLLSRLIDDLRDLALAEAGELTLEKRPVDLAELVRQIGEAIALSVEDAPKFTVRERNKIPQVELDPKRFRQVLANLIGNAVRYTPSDGEISVDIRRVGDEVELCVSDTGPGILEEDLPHLFERFYRGDPARNRVGGTGLGLAIVKQWVEAHGGRIWAENRVAGGARFTVRLTIA
ncbi:HAMP domain-containing protein [Candidatus Bipolaricaulota bacterium]|nr:HAMP domain-containing protein [Candidatus Bipolaricaulota bacterium]